MRLPEHPQSVASCSATECKSSCLKNYSCTTYAYDRNGCSIWTMDLINPQQLLENDSSGSSLYLKLAASEFSRDNNIGIIIGVVGLVIVVLGLIYVMWKQQRRLIETPCIQRFAKSNQKFLGENGKLRFCSVFKGPLPDSTVIAVKKLKSNKKLLGYDYMQNGSLDSHLFHGKESKVLDWKTRYQIALGTTRWLAYLHEECRDYIQSEAGVFKFFPIRATSVVIEGGDVHCLLDHMLEKHDVEEAWRICKVACWCIQDDENDRPSMGQVVQILERIM
ncbi:hypothetical protein CsSME_00019512 [Camellia sinensis var. sinensis]